ncbi:MAG: hydrogenase expression/formation protein HypE [Chromatiales bacterium]|jgi:hydrogenase expression/formation protein HypE
MTEDKLVTLAHGNGGRFMRAMIEDIFARHLHNDLLDVRTDASLLPAVQGELMFSVDGFTVQPLQFPGGDIGSLAVHGTVNDLAVSGAEPLYLSLSAIIEEGIEFGLLDQLVASLAEAARHAGVRIVTGDTKVVPHGAGGGVYFTTSGIGVRGPQQLGLQNIQASDAVLVSGPVGDHGACVMLAREEFGLSGDLQSDNACVLPLTRTLQDLPGLRFMRDPTRGGLATVAHEIAVATGLNVRLDETSIPVRDPVRSVCDMLGYDPYYLACEGRVVAVVDAEQADDALQRWQALADGQLAAIIGRIETGSGKVVLQTELGGERLLDELEDNPLPRIC